MRAFINRWFFIGLIAAVVCFVITGCLTLYAYGRSHPDVVIPRENRGGFVRVAVLMDGTNSVGEDNFTAIKEIVQRKIVRSLGANDIAIAYDVQDVFTTKRNAVFGLQEDQMPQDPESRRAEILATLGRNRQSSEKGHVEDRMYNLIRAITPRRERVEEVRRAWEERVQTREPPKVRGSDICHPLQDIGEFLIRGGNPDAEKWLFILSDLQDTRTATCEAAEPPPPDTRILVIHPFDPKDPEGKKVERYWRTFFGGRKLERVPFSAALADDALLPPNPTAGIEPHEIGTFWECARPLLGSALLLGLASTAAISWSVFLARRRSAK